jgi:hypothetical protein
MVAALRFLPPPPLITVRNRDPRSDCRKCERFLMAPSPRNAPVRLARLGTKRRNRAFLSHVLCRGLKMKNARYYALLKKAEEYALRAEQRLIS